MTTGVFIGRFQPLHNAHLEIIEDALEKNDKVLVFVGSANRSRSCKNPFTYEERKSFIEQSVKNPKLQVLPLNDYPQDTDWFHSLKTQIEKNKLAGKVKFYGSAKDASSYYLQYLGYTKDSKNLFVSDEGELIEDNIFIECKVVNKIDAEFIRSTLFERNMILSSLIPYPVFQFLLGFRIQDIYWELLEEYKHIKQYKEAWKVAPYPPIFVTVDAVVQYQNSILFIKRKNPPGKDLYALPGGFVDSNETLDNAVLRELNEETGMKLKVTDIRDRNIFDNPNRSVRGRNITVAYYFDVSNKPEKIINLKVGDDVSTFTWIDKSKLSGDYHQFHDDHVDIVRSFVDLNIVV